MKKILIRSYNGDWSESDLDYNNEIAYFQKRISAKHKESSDFELTTDDAYCRIRNATSSIVSYAIVEIEEFPDTKIYSCGAKFRHYTNAVEQVQLMAKYFFIHFGKNPNVLLVNHKTIFEMENNSKNALGIKYEMIKLECDLLIRINSEIKNDEYFIIYDGK